MPRELAESLNRAAMIKLENGPLSPRNIDSSRNRINTQQT